MANSGCCIRVAVGSLLLTAAWLKYTSNSHVDVLIIKAEAMLGIWLISGWAYRYAWTITILLFLGAIPLNVHAMFTGEPCACFGNVVRLQPWVTGVLDLGVIVLLGVASPKAKGVRNENGSSAVESWCRVAHIKRHRRAE